MKNVNKSCRNRKQLVSLARHGFIKLENLCYPKIKGQREENEKMKEEMKGREEFKRDTVTET